MSFLQGPLDLIEPVTISGITFLFAMAIVSFTLRAMPALWSIICVSVLTWVYFHDTTLSPAIAGLGIALFIGVTLLIRIRERITAKWIKSAVKNGQDKSEALASNHVASSSQSNLKP